MYNGIIGSFYRDSIVKLWVYMYECMNSPCNTFMVNIITTGSVSAMLICGSELDFNFRPSVPSRGPQPWWQFPILHIQPFKKQLCHKSVSKTNGERNDDSSLSVPTHVRGIDPVSLIFSS